MTLAIIMASITGYILINYIPCKVDGLSMHPTLYDNDYVLAKRVFNKNKIKEGQMYLFKSPTGHVAVKRLSFTSPLRGKTMCYFLGDNPTESYDSRQYGYVKAENIIATVIWHKKH